MQNNAVGSGFAGFVCAVIALSTNQFGIMQTAFVASFGSKLSDTVSSEVGKGTVSAAMFCILAPPLDAAVLGDVLLPCLPSPSHFVRHCLDIYTPESTMCSLTVLALW